MLNFFDFEVFKCNWLVVIINPLNKTKEIIIDDVEKLQKYYDEHKNEIWVGYNSRHYDQWILKGILCGFNPKEINDFIIADGKKGYQFSGLLNKISINNYDVFLRNDGGLKSLEGFMGNDIKESSVPFDIDRPLTDDEIQETVKYCTHDVEQTIEVFLNRKADFDAQMGLIKLFKLPLQHIGKTKAQLAAICLDAHMKSHNDEFDIELPDTLRVEKYKHIVNWYLDENNRDYSKSLEIDVAGVPHLFGWGGLHGAIDKYYGEGYFINVDVASYYPSMILRYNWISRNVLDPKKYEEIYNNRLKYKAEKNPMQLPLKTLLNSTYGAMKDKFNQLYDPRQANNICVGGQLMLLDLLEKLEPYCKIIQSNTDGILIKIDRKEDFDLIDDICYEWESRTGMNLEFDLFKKVFQKDVNNYVLVDFDGNYKAKGAYVKKLSNLDYDLAIVNEALVNYMIYGTPIEKTINDCRDLRKFQKIVKVSGKYLYGLKNPTFSYTFKDEWGSKTKVKIWNRDGEKLTDRTFRVFASNRQNDGGIFKLKNLTSNPEKFANTPESCFIINDDLQQIDIDSTELNRQWYIDMANERLRQFGVI